MIFALNFENPLQISAGNYVDDLVFKIKDPEVNIPKFFKFKDTPKKLPEKFAILRY